MSKIILVGNSESILNNKNGHYIDQFPNVVRFNNYVLDGLAEHTGSKTTTWARQAGDRVSSRLNKYHSIIIFITYCKWTSILKGNAKKLSKKYPKAIIVPQSFSKSVGARLGLNQPNKQWPSIGMLAIQYYVDLGYDVTITGFSFCNSHYYNYTVMDSDKHNWPAERSYVDHLVVSKAVRIL